MDCDEYSKLKKKLFILVAKYYLELENNLNNMCDAELGISKEEISKVENELNIVNIFINNFSKYV